MLISISRLLSAGILCTLFPICSHAHMEASAEKSNKTPFSFIENKGQIVDQNGNQRNDIDFKLSLSGMNVFLGDAQLHYQWNKCLTKHDPLDPVKLSAEEFVKAKHDHTRQADQYQTYRLDVKLLGADLSAPVVSTEKQAYYETYYLHQCQGQVAATFNKITYRNVYPNIDWVLYTHNSVLKYDFIVHPGGNPKDIKLQYDGATSLSLNDGMLTATTPLGTVREEKPYTYAAQTRQVIASKYLLKGDVLSFDIAANTTEGDMVIDPTINWGTYYGDGGGEMGGAVEADNGGNSYLGGSTGSISNMATVGAHQVTQGGGSDGFLVKFTPSGTRVWATYYGDQYDEGFYSIAYDPFSGSIYAAGTSESTTGIATTGAHQSTYGGGTVTGGGYYGGDAILIKFTSSGTRIWGTYYGGTGYEYEASVACDGLGNVFLAGGTLSSTNIASATGAYQPAIGGQQDAFLAKFNGSGVRQWGTYFGGSDYEYGASVACDGGGNIYIVGETTSTSNISSGSTVYQPAHGGGYYDGYIAKFNTSGTLSWSTYYGGSSYDGLSDASCDAAGNVYVGGFTYSTAGIATIGAYQTTINGYYDAYLAKFNSSGAIQWGTYYGGDSWEQVAGIEARPDGSFFAVGITYSTTGIATTNAYQPAFSGYYDAYLSEWNTSGSRIYGTYYGGTGYEYTGGGGWGGGGGFGWGGGGGGVSWTPAGYVFLAGGTQSGTNIATSNGYQTTYGGGGSGSWYYNGDAFLASFIVDTMVAIRQPYVDTVLCPGDSVKIPYVVTYNFRAGNTFTAELSDPTGSFATTTTIGTITSVSNDTIRCQIPLTITPGTAYRIRIKATTPSRTSGDNEINIRIKPMPSAVTAGSNAPICQDAMLNLTGSASITGGGTITYSWVGPNNYTSTAQNPVIFPAGIGYDGDYTVTATSDGCSAEATTTVEFLPDPAVPLAGNNGPVCPGSTINLTANSTTPGVTYQWTGPAAFNSSLQNPTVSNASSTKAGNYSVIATAPNGCSSDPGMTTVVVKPPVTVPTAGGNTPICTGSTLQLTASTVAGATYQWSGPNGFSSTLQNPTIPGITPSQAGIYEVKAYLNDCWSNPGQINVVTTTVSFIGGYASPNDTICAGTVPTFVALPANEGPSPVYQWYKNFAPIPGATSLRYSDAAIADGDQYYCTMYSVGVCPDPVNASTDTILMTVVQTTTKPEVTISSTPQQPLPGTSITFNAHITNGGYTPTYQWFRNDNMIWGATYSNWTANNLEPYDKISVVGYTSDPCAEVATDTSDAIIVNFPTGINNIQDGHSLNLYPNPNNGDFKLSGSINGKSQATLSIINVAGQSLYQEKAQPKNGMIDHDINAKGKLVPGVYILRIEQDGSVQNIRFTVSK